MIETTISLPTLHGAGDLLAKLTAPASNSLDVPASSHFTGVRRSPAAGVGRRLVLGIPPGWPDMLRRNAHSCRRGRAPRSTGTRVASTFHSVKSKLVGGASWTVALMSSLSEKGLRKDHALRRSWSAMLAITVTSVLVWPGAMRSPSDFLGRAGWYALNSSSPSIVAGSVHLRRRIKARSQPVHMADAILSRVGRIQWNTDDVVLYSSDAVLCLVLLSPASSRGPPSVWLQIHPSSHSFLFHPAVSLQSDLHTSPQPSGRPS
jgi:hypothetical protein